jgi:hypothetical protein
VRAPDYHVHFDYGVADRKMKAKGVTMRPVAQGSYGGARPSSGNYFISYDMIEFGSPRPVCSLFLDIQIFSSGDVPEGERKGNSVFSGRIISKETDRAGAEVVAAMIDAFFKNLRMQPNR